MARIHAHAIAKWGIRAAGTAAVLIGGFWLVAWLGGSWAARWSAAGTTITVKTNMALCLLLGGIGIWLLEPSRVTQLRRFAGALLASVIMLVGALTLTEHISGYGLGIDQILAVEKPGALATASPNRIGPPGSISLILLGAGLLALSLKRRSFAPYLGLVVCVINFVPAVGFLYGSPELYNRPHLTGIAWPTVVALISLGMGLVLAYPENRLLVLLLSSDAGGALFRRMLPGAILIPLILGLIRSHGQVHGFYDTAVGTSLLVIALILVFSGFLWSSARHLSRSTAAEAEAYLAIRESEARLNQAQQIADVGSWEWDITTGALSWSEQVYRQMGEESGRFLPTHEAFLQHVHPEDRPATETAARQALSGAAPYELDFRIVRPDGAVRILHSRGKVEHGPDGQPRRIVGVCLDITERKRVEQENAQLASFPVLNPNPIVEADLNGKVLYVNPSALKLFPDLPDRGPEHPYMMDWERVKNACLQNSSPAQREVVAGERWYLQAAHYLKEDEKIRIYGWDITDRKQAEEETRTLLRAIEEEKEKLTALIDSIQDEVWFADQDNKLSLVNRAVIRNFGLNAGQEVEGIASSFEVYRPDYTLRPVDEAPPLLALRGEVVSNEEELVRIPSTGELRHRQVSAAPVRNAQAKIIGSVSVVRDITDRKKMEDELRQSRAELEQRVKERTAELSQTVESLAAEVTQRMDAEKALRERSDQLRHLTSELTLTEQRERMRLAQILHDGLQQILVGAKYRLATLERSQDIRAAISELSDILDDAIGTSRSLTSELSPPILKEGGLVPALEWLTRWMDEKHGLAVALTVHDTIDPEPEDTTLLLFQAVRELLFNIVKHAYTKTARVELAQRDGEIQIAVEDKGVGFNPDEIRGERGISGGFGLFSIRERISLFGGRVEIDSARGRGSRFKLVVPLSTRTDLAAVSPESNLQLSPTVSLRRHLEPSDREKITIALVDDHMVMRQGLAGLLRGQPDFQIVGEASDGVSAVKLIREIRPDVVLMDVSMPGMNGIDATRIICKEMPEIRVIGLSMFEEGEKAAAMRDAGAVNYLTKSGPAEELISAIRAAGLTLQRLFKSKAPQGS